MSDDAGLLLRPHSARMFGRTGGQSLPSSLIEGRG